MAFFNPIMIAEYINNFFGKNKLLLNLAKSTKAAGHASASILNNHNFSSQAYASNTSTNKKTNLMSQHKSDSKVNAVSASRGGSTMLKNKKGSQMTMMPTDDLRKS